MQLWCLALTLTLTALRTAPARKAWSQRGRLQLAAYLLRSDAPDFARRLGAAGATDGTTATSSTWHNGTAEERVVNATWQCTYPEGKCFHNHAPLEGLPEKMEACVSEHNIDPLTVQMSIDLTCAGMTNVHCNEKVETRKFDPFYLCNNNPLLLTAECQMQCHDRRPFQNCTFHFDSEGVYNMSDETVDICTLEATCMSPYIEQNQMICSGHETVGKFKPHWTQRALPDRKRADHGIRGALKQQAPKSRSVSKALSTIALVLFFGSAAFGVYRLGVFSDPQRFLDGIFGSARSLSISRIGGSYQAPRVDGSTRPYTTPDEELHSLNGAG